MPPGHPLLEFVGTRYARAQIDDDELRLRAVELITAACVREWVDLPDVAKAVRVQPPPVVTEDVPKIDYDDLVPPDAEEPDDLPEFPAFEPAEPEPSAEDVPEPKPKERLTDDEQRSWWGASPEPADTEPVRGAWEPPKPS